MAGKGYPCHFLFICSTRIFFSTWTILSGPFLLMPVIHLRKCIANMNMICYFRSFDHFYELYEKRNIELWAEYADGKVTKEELNRQRFLYPLEAVGEGDAALAKAFSDDFFAVIPTKSRLMPHAQEVLEYLAPKYNLYILSNGFQELQCHKMRSAGIDHYFKKVVLSDDIGILKPWPEIFHFAMSATQSELRESLMVGDSWENDITGAQGVGMHQVFYNVTGRTEFSFKPTYQITDLKELLQLL